MWGKDKSTIQTKFIVLAIGKKKLQRGVPSLPKVSKSLFWTVLIFRVTISWLVKGNIGNTKTMGIFLLNYDAFQTIQHHPTSILTINTNLMNKIVAFSKSDPLTIQIKIKGLKHIGVDVKL